MFRSAWLASVLTAAALDAQCAPTITQQTTLNGGWFCSTVTYTYTVCNPSPCVLPIRTIRLKFGQGVGLVSPGSILAPAGWSGSGDPATDEVVWVAGTRAVEIQPNACETFSVGTICTPGGIEGIQSADLFAFGGTLIHAVTRTDFVLAGTPYRNFVAGSDDAPIGRTYVVGITSPCDPVGQNLLLASPFSAPTGLSIPGIGWLMLDPSLVIPLATIPLNQDGVGEVRIPIPATTELVGGRLHLQSLALSALMPRLSNLKTVTFR